MKARLGTLIEREGADGTYLAGTLGEAVVILERDGETRAGAARWRLMLATPHEPHRDKKQQAHNRRHATQRMERKRADGITTVGGDYR